MFLKRLWFWRRRVTYRVTEFFEVGASRGETFAYQKTGSKRVFKRDFACVARDVKIGAIGSARIEILDKTVWKPFAIFTGPVVIMS